VGMMEGAFFVGRTELLDWVNGLLSVNLTKVEQAASGAIYCQILDSCHPGTVKMSKVNWMGRSDHEFIPNYKILQSAFDRNNIDKHIPVDMLIRAKYQDNLEMMQWMKAMADREGASGSDYDPVRARQGTSLPPWAKPVGCAVGRADTPVEKENCSTNRAEHAGADKKFDPSARRAPARGAAAKSAPQRAAPAAVAPQRAAPRTAARPGAAPVSARMSASEHQELKLKVEEQAEELREMGDVVDGLENERDYYFRKLRFIEILCSKANNPEQTSADLLEQITGILYAENDEEEPTENLEVPLDSQGEEVSAASLQDAMEFVGAEQGVTA